MDGSNLPAGIPYAVQSHSMQMHHPPLQDHQSQQFAFPLHNQISCHLPPMPHDAFPPGPHCCKSSPNDDDDDSAAVVADGQVDGSKKGSSWQRVKWTDTMVRLLVTAVSYVDEDVGGTGDGKGKHAMLKKKGKWKAISKVLAERGCCASPQQCEDKFNDLNKRYKRLTYILGRGTSCQVVENPSLLAQMHHIPEKAKEAARKILNSKHLHYEEMCSYHNKNHVSLPPDPALQRSLLSVLRSHDTLGARTRDSDADNQFLDFGDTDDHDDNDDDEDGDNNNGEGSHLIDSPVMGLSYVEMMRQSMDPKCADGESAGWGTDAESIRRKLIEVEERGLRIQEERLELEKQRFRWQRFSSKKERELERMKLENERMKLENDRMIMELRNKELELDHKGGHRSGASGHDV